MLHVLILVLLGSAQILFVCGVIYLIRWWIKGNKEHQKYLDMRYGNNTETELEDDDECKE